MILPNDEICRCALDEMEEFLDDLTAWQHEFVTSNHDRKSFTPRQREVIASFGEQYTIKALQR